jgi:hypothetical protein
MDDRVDALHRTVQTISITDVAEEEAESIPTFPGREVRLSHLRLLELVTGEDDEALEVKAGEECLSKAPTEGAGSARD